MSEERIDQLYALQIKIAALLHAEVQATNYHSKFPNSAENSEYFAPMVAYAENAARAAAWEPLRIAGSLRWVYQKLENGDTASAMRAIKDFLDDAARDAGEVK
jgi:hypothetical protein